MKGCLAINIWEWGRKQKWEMSTCKVSPIGSSELECSELSGVGLRWPGLLPHGSAPGKEQGQRHFYSTGHLLQRPWKTICWQQSQKWAATSFSLRGDLAHHSSCHTTVRWLQQPVLKGTHLSHKKQHLHTFYKLCSSYFYAIIIMKDKSKLLTPKSFQLKTTSCTSHSLTKVIHVRY